MQDKKKILLIVDDEDHVREVVRECTEDLFDQVIEAADGDEALKQIESVEPTVIVSDFNMPRFNGLELLGMLRNLKKEAPVVWLTGRGSRELHREALAAGVYDYFEKPFDPNELRNSLVGAINLMVDGSGVHSKPNFLTKIKFEEVSVLLDKNLHRDLVQHCIEKGISINSLVNQLLVEVLSPQTTEIKKQKAA